MDVSENATQPPPNGRPQVNQASAFAVEIARELSKALQQNAGGFLAPIRFKRPNPNSGVQEEVTTCVAQQLENICIMLSAVVRGQAELVAAIQNQTNATGELIRATDENTDAAGDEPDDEPKPRRRK
jgi:hypothetical protein